MAMEEFSQEQLDAATPEELAEAAASILERLEPGRQPLPLFKQLARIMVISTVEVAPFRSNDNEVEVLLGKRSDEDPWRPGAWHVPGAVLLPTDTEVDMHDYASPTDRIFESEFEETVKRTGDVSVFDVQRRTGLRGSEQTVFCLTDVDLIDESQEPLGGAFFNVAYVLRSDPDDWGLIPHHKNTIEAAYRSYSNTESS